MMPTFLSSEALKSESHHEANFIVSEALKSESDHNINFVITDRTEDCRYDNWQYRH